MNDRAIKWHDALVEGINAIHDDYNNVTDNKNAAIINAHRNAMLYLVNCLYEEAVRSQ